MNSHRAIDHDAEHEPRKLVSLEVHDRLGNAKTTKKYFLMLKWDVPYIDRKLNRRAFQQAKEQAN